jgi:apolipoprotein N-acyltransferase
MWAAIFLSALSGVLLTAGFPALELYYVSWFALIPLLVALQKADGSKQAIRLGYICGLVHFLTALYWIRYVVYHYGGLPLPVALFVLLLLSAYLAIYPACFAYFAHRWQDRPVLWVLGLPCLWVTLEWIRAHAVTGFPWANLGYTQTPLISLVQVADITGVYGLSWLVVLGNTALMAVLNISRFGMRTALSSAAIFAACFAAAISYGAWRIGDIERFEKNAKDLTVGVVQGNIDQSQKWDPAFKKETLKRYRDLSLKAAAHDPRPDLLVWPETSVPFFYGIDEKLTPELNEILKEIGRPLLFGSPGIKVIDGQARLQNRAYITDGNAKLLGAYAKQHLVPFGEYVPLQKILFFVNRLVQAAGDFVPGNDPAPLVLDGIRLGVLICYEDVFPRLARMTVQRDAVALVNITNDAWYGDTSAPYQHVEMARWRAIEFRVPMVRAANTGISGLFDATGRARGIIPLNQEGYLVSTLRPFPIMTFYARWGDLFAWGCVLIAVSGALHSLKRKHRSVSMVLD